MREVGVAAFILFAIGVLRLYVYAALKLHPLWGIGILTFLLVLYKMGQILTDDH